MSTSATIIKLPRASAGGRVTQARVAVSEWTKLRSLRSTRWTLLATGVLTIGFGIIASAVTSSRWPTMSAAEKATFDPLKTSLLGVNFGLLAIGVLGVLTVEGLSAEQIGQTAAREGLVLYELTPDQVSLEEAFMELTHDDIEYRTGTPTQVFDPIAPDINEPERIAA